MGVLRLHFLAPVSYQKAVKLLRISIPKKVCQYGQHYNRWCLWTVAFLAKNHTCIDEMCFNITVLTWSSTSTVDPPPFWEDVKEENSRSDSCWKCRTYHVLYNSYRVVEKLPHLWSQCFHSYRVMEENSILGCNSGHYSVVGSLQKLITLRLTLKPLLLLQLSTVLCCSVIPKCRQQKRNKWNVMFICKKSLTIYV